MYKFNKKYLSQVYEPQLKDFYKDFKNIDSVNINIDYESRGYKVNLAKNSKQKTMFKSYLFLLVLEV